MIRVLSFAGSCAGEKSHTKRISDQLAAIFTKKAEAEGFQVSYECVTGDQIRVDYCRSCNSCFKTGVCPLDSGDDMPGLKQKLTDADVIFFGTPVYLWEMSGITKSVLDRISYWAHRFELAGKVGVTIASTDTSHGPQVADSLRELLRFTGLTVVDAVALHNSASPCLYRADETETVLNAAADKLLAAWKDPAACVEKIQEQIWASRVYLNRRAEKFYSLLGSDPWDEVKVCAQRNVGGFASYADYVRDVHAKRNA
jgi:Multimeric flavodoxin WrbA